MHARAWSKPGMAQKLLLLLAYLSVVFCGHEAAVAAPEQIAIAATGKAGIIW